MWVYLVGIFFPPPPFSHTEGNVMKSNTMNGRKPSNPTLFVSNQLLQMSLLVRCSLEFSMSRDFSF